ncbi:MAG: hypothetical protein Q8S75_00680, partial [Nitrospirota bacterium]|nr:hypothetical protein [Nitrospirota bacterium]
MRRGLYRPLTGGIGDADCYRGISIQKSLPETVVGLRFFFGIAVGLDNEVHYHQVIHPSSLAFPSRRRPGWFPTARVERGPSEGAR